MRGLDGRGKGGCCCLHVPWGRTGHMACLNSIEGRPAEEPHAAVFVQ